MEVSLIYIVLACHWIFDFVLQNNWMSLNKSKNTIEGISAISIHSFIYSIWGLLLWTEYLYAFLFFSHLIIDFFTSRLNAWLWKKNQVHYFFVSVGFDQLLHVASIIWFLNLCGYKLI